MQYPVYCSQDLSHHHNSQNRKPVKWFRGDLSKPEGHYILKESGRAVAEKNFVDGCWKFRLLRNFRSLAFLFKCQRFAWVLSWGELTFRNYIIHTTRHHCCRFLWRQKEELWMWNFLLSYCHFTTLWHLTRIALNVT